MLITNHGYSIGMNSSNTSLPGILTELARKFCDINGDLTKGTIQNVSNYKDKPFYELFCNGQDPVNGSITLNFDYTDDPESDDYHILYIYQDSAERDLWGYVGLIKDNNMIKQYFKIYKGELMNSTEEEFNSFMYNQAVVLIGMFPDDFYRGMGLLSLGNSLLSSDVIKYLKISGIEQSPSTSVTLSIVDSNDARTNGTDGYIVLDYSMQIELNNIRNQLNELSDQMNQLSGSLEGSFISG